MEKNAISWECTGWDPGVPRWKKLRSAGRNEARILISSLMTMLVGASSICALTLGSSDPPRIECDGVFPTDQNHKTNQLI